MKKFAIVSSIIGALFIWMILSTIEVFKKVEDVFDWDEDEYEL